MSVIYDTIIIGGGPAGLSAGLYASRGKMDTLLIEKGLYGGQITTTLEVENYPGAIRGITGPELAVRMKEQAQEFGTKFIEDSVVAVELSEKVKTVKCSSGDYQAKTVIITTGAFPRLAGFKKEEELRGRGVSYCATCDGFFYRNKEVAVIGGGDSALQEAIFLTKFASKVTVIHRRNTLRASRYLQDMAERNEKIHYLLNTVVEEALGEESLEGLKIKNTNSGDESIFKVEGCFVFVGFKPLSEPFKGILDMNGQGNLKTDEDMNTNVPGVFAAGDIRDKSVRQIITAASDGVIAAISAEKYINEKYNQEK